MFAHDNYLRQHLRQSIIDFCKTNQFQVISLIPL